MSGYEDTAQDLVENKFASAETYASESFANTSDYVDALQVLLGELKSPDVSDISDIDVPDITPINYAARPTMGTTLFSGGDAKFINPGGKYNDIADVSTKNLSKITPVPAFTSVPHNLDTITLPKKPSPVTAGSVTIPEKLTLTGSIPKIPTFTSIKFPAAIIYDPGAFSATEVGAFIDKLPTEFSYTEDTYSSVIETTLFKIISDGLNTGHAYNGQVGMGTTGINEAVEQVIYDRAKNRQQRENDAMYQAVSLEYGASGFNLPTGIMLAKLSEVQMEITRKLDEINYEILLGQSNLAREYKQFMVDKAIQYEGMMKEFFNQTATRTFEQQKIIAAYSMEIYKAAIEKHNLKLEIYKTEAAVYETKIRAKLASVELYKSQIQAIGMKVDINKSEVDIYLGQLAGIQAQYDVYKTRMDGAKVETEIEQLKIETFSKSVQAYVAGIEAEKMKIDIYTSKVGAEKVKAETYVASIEAFKTKVEAERLKIGTEVTVKELQLKENQYLIEKYRANISKYQAELQADSNTNDRELKAFQAMSTAYSVETEADKAVNLTKIEEMKTLISKAQLEVQKIVQELQLTVQSYVALKELQVKGTEGIMNVGSQLAASAMNSVNASASYGFGSSRSGTYAYRPDVFKSESITETHTYNHPVT